MGATSKYIFGSPRLLAISANLFLISADGKYGSNAPVANLLKVLALICLSLNSLLNELVSTPSIFAEEIFQIIEEKQPSIIAFSSTTYTLERCNEIAKLPNIVAIKYSVPRELYKELTQLAGDNLIVSTASEDEWLDNIEELNWRLYLCSSPPYLYQTSNDKRMREYTDLAFSGNFKQAREVRDSLNPVREAINKTKPAEKPPAHGKYWQELLGQVGGKVRRPMLDLTEDEKNNTRIAFESCGLKL